MEKFIRNIELDEGRTMALHKDTGYTADGYELFSYKIYDIDFQVIKSESGFSSEQQAETAGRIANAIERRKDATTR